jgi:alpha-tubulin suppressor-like RCC1 family protein
MEVNTMSGLIKNLAMLILTDLLLITACSQHNPTKTSESQDLSADNVTPSLELVSTAQTTAIPTGIPTEAINEEAYPVIASVPVRSIATGYTHSLALQQDGDVLGWGAADVLGLSEDEEATQPVPILLPGIHDIKAIYARGFYSLFVDSAGRIRELSLFERGKHSLLPGIDHVEQIATGDNQTILALKDDGSVWAWGAGEKGQVGTGDLTDTAKFVRVPLDDVRQVGFAGNLALAVRKDGSLWCWGQSEGITGSQDIRSSPQMVQEVENVQSVAYGDGVNILHNDGSVTVWIDGEFHSVEQLPPIMQIDGVYQTYNLGVATNGTFWVWGSLWVNAVYPPDPPYDRTFGLERYQGHQIDLKNIVQVSADGGVIVALDKEGTVWAWGQSGYGEIGTGLVRGLIRIPTQIIKSP